MAKAKKALENNTVNIKSIPVQAHIGSSKFENDDWGTVAFIIPRTSIQLQFADKELQYNSIYFLIGYDGAEEMVYVGQAKKRNGGGSVLVRLREHDKSTTEKYRDIWQWIVVVTNKNDAWGLDELNALENAFYNEIPLDKNLNGNNPNSGGADIALYADKIVQIKSYITSMGFHVFAEDKDVDTEHMVVESVTNDFTIVEDLQSGMARIPEIVTPDRIVKQMVDMLPEEIWNPDTKFLDPACKGGEYLKEVYDRLMDAESVIANFPDKMERHEHILNEQIYGIALSQVSLERTTKKLYGHKSNIRIIQNYINILKGAGLGSKADGSDKTFLDKLNEEFNTDMKIDVVIGNPPYQESNGGGTGSGANSLYEKFIENAIKMPVHNVCMITKSSWFNGNGYKDFRKKFLGGKHIRSIVDYTNSEEVFTGMDGIAGGVSYFLWDAEYTGDCEFTNHNRKNTSSEKMDFNKDIIIRYPILDRIVSKITMSEQFKNISNIVSGQTPFGFNTNALDSEAVSVIETDNENIKLVGSRGRDGWVSINDIKKNAEWVPYYKVLINQAMSGGCKTDDNGMSQVLSKPFIIKPNEVCTQTYLVVGVTSNINVCKSIEKYLSTKFVRILMLATLTSKSINPESFRFVPMLDFVGTTDVDWSQSVDAINDKLCDLYELSTDERKYIDATIKPMK